MEAQTSTDSLQQNPFLVNLAATFHVTSIPLAIFILIVICIGCVVILAFLFMCVRFSLRKKYLTKSQKKRMKSVYMDELSVLEETQGEYGQLLYSVEYDVSLHTLRVVIDEAKDLKLPSEAKSLDVYATLKVATEKRGRMIQVGKAHKTEIKRRTTLPRWHYQCDFTIPQEELKYTCLLFELFDYDSIGQDLSIGRLLVPLASVDQCEFVGATLECSGQLKPGEPKYSGLGELCVGLTYNAKTERIEVHVYEARQLKLSHLALSRKQQAIFVHVEFHVKRRIVGTFDSSPKTELINPYFNEKATFVLKECSLSEAFVVCRLRKKGRLGQKQDLAFITIGPNSELSTGSKHWDEMIHNSPRTHVMWHTWTPRT